MQRNAWWMTSVAVLMACGGGAAPAVVPEEPSSTPAPSATEAPPAAPGATAQPADRDDSAEATPRAKEAAKWLRDMSAEDPSFRGILATNGLSDAQFGLPEPLRRGMDAVTSGRVDPSQADRIILAALEEGAGEVVQGLCGKPLAALVDEAVAAPAEMRARLVVDRCKLSRLVDLANVPEDSFVFPLLSAVVQKLFEAEGGHARAEFELAKMIAAARRPTE